MELALLVTTFAGIKKASDIASSLARGDITLEKAELKMKLADVVGELADARMALTRVSEVIDTRDTEIARLQDALAIKATVVRVQDAYYEVGEDDAPSGDAYCLQCWENSNSLRHLVRDANTASRRCCPECKSSYSANTTWLG